MVTFLCSIVILILGYIFYGKYIQSLIEPKIENKTPAYTLSDGVDYVPLKKRKNALIQLLNIAGVGPIFGPILGALYGPVAFIWIVLGAIFAGAVHDYLIGMISTRNKGAHLPDLAGLFLGKGFKHVVNFFSLLLLFLVGTVFVTAPSKMLFSLFEDNIPLVIITMGIFAYYFIATLLPIDKIIGRIYPILGALLAISAVCIGAYLIFTGSPIPEVHFTNLHPEEIPIFPGLLLTISCGALSGFHATQSPIISRTIENEKDGKFIFYGMMITEAVIAMIWAAAAMALFSHEELQLALKEGGPGNIVKIVSTSALGTIGGAIAVLGVIILPITSGDTSFRSARMIIADYFSIDQKKIINRFLICIPLFLGSYFITLIDFGLLWRYFSWANQSTAGLALWVGAIYLAKHSKPHWVASLPAALITAADLTYIFSNKIGFNIPMGLSQLSGVIITLFLLALVHFKAKSSTK